MPLAPPTPAGFMLATTLLHHRRHRARLPSSAGPAKAAAGLAYRVAGGLVALAGVAVLAHWVS